MGRDPFSTLDLGPGTLFLSHRLCQAFLSRPYEISDYTDFRNMDGLLLV